MSLGEVPRSRIPGIPIAREPMLRSEHRWSPQEAIARLSQLQGQTVDLGAVLEHNMPNHVHFDAHAPHVLQTEIASALQGSEPLDERQNRLTQAYTAYLQEQGLEGRVLIMLYEFGHDKQIAFAEAIFPEQRLWRPETVTSLFPMVDFAVQFPFSETVSTAIQKNNDFFSFLTRTPVVTVNTTRAEDNPGSYQVDILLNNRPVDEEQLKETLELLIPWYGVYKNLGIHHSLDAVTISEEGQQLVTSLLDARRTASNSSFKSLLFL